MPEILQYAEYVELPGLKKELVIEWKLAGNKESELYRLLLTAQCNALSRTIPFLFGWIDDETDLLLPHNLLKTDSLIRSLVENLTAEDCESVEVLGWLYQFYIAERKDLVMARKSAVPTEDNRLFIAAYGLDGELQPEVPEAQITLARAEARRDMAAFLSYAVGCMMGRYSLDHPGLILGNAGDTLREFLERVGKPQAELTFTPDDDGIIVWVR